MVIEVYPKLWDLAQFGSVGQLWPADKLSPDGLDGGNELPSRCGLRSSIDLSTSGTGSDVSPTAASNHVELRAYMCEVP